jgi:hypothetical protein
LPWANANKTRSYSRCPSRNRRFLITPCFEASDSLCFYRVNIVEFLCFRAIGDLLENLHNRNLRVWRIGGWWDDNQSSRTLHSRCSTPSATQSDTTTVIVFLVSPLGGSKVKAMKFSLLFLAVVAPTTAFVVSPASSRQASSSRSSSALHARPQLLDRTTGKSQLDPAVIDRYDRLPYPAETILAEYVWVDAVGNTRSKTRTLPASKVRIRIGLLLLVRRS